MFSELEKNVVMVEGAYKKLKSYYHYNKNFVFMKKKIADYEYEFERLEHNLYELAELLLPNNFERLNEKVDEWVNQIGYYIMPKSFENKKISDVITNDMVLNNPINKVNFFIDMPIELHILDCLWTVLAGKIVYDKRILTGWCFGNCIDNSIVYNRSSDFYESINFSKNKLFKIYFEQYCNWKNKLIEKIDFCNKAKISTVLFSLDIKSYYYSVRLKFSQIEKVLESDNYKKIVSLNKIMEKVFMYYTEMLRNVRKLEQEEDEFVLPIGLLSSMLLANVYASEIDKKLLDNPQVKYYGRYVDDILVLIETEDSRKDILKKNYFEKVMVEKMSMLMKTNESSFCFAENTNLVIQKEKVKTIYFEGGKSHSLIKKLEKTKIIPSQMNIVPSTDITLLDFEEAAYLIKGFQTETKIREVGPLEIDRFGLGRYLAQFVQISCEKVLNLPKEEKIYRQEEREKIINFFKKSRCLEYSSNWVNVLYIMILSGDESGFRRFEYNVRKAIQNLKISEIEGIGKKQNQEVKKALKKCMLLHFKICVAVALAVFPGFDKSENDIYDLAIKLRHANLFNHHLVTFPLVNYTENLKDEENLTDLSVNDINEFDYKILDSPKIKWTPRFISLDEIFLWTFLENIYRGGNFFATKSNEKIEFIVNFFCRANCINTYYANPILIDIKNNHEVNGYLQQFINLGNPTTNLKKEEIKVAIVNVDMDTKRCVEKIDNQREIMYSKSEFYQILKESYEKKVEFILFPEFYLPVEWLRELLIFARRTKITVVTGLNYITVDSKENKRVINNIAVIAPFTSKRYCNCFLMVREKNDYAPLEKKLVALKSAKCYDQEVPNYQIFFNKGIRYGTFLCYEFTDIIARALYKNKVDFLFTPEHNSDIGYFASIIESMTRDLHTFIIQANTSSYGDSRITGPYSRNDRNIIQIKGGEGTIIIVGTIELKKIKKFQENAKEELRTEVDKLYSLSYVDKEKELEKLLVERDKKVSTLSARTYE